jgi:chemotaxis protein histidine kinase CheA
METVLASRTAWSVSAAREAFGADKLTAALDRDLANLAEVIGEDRTPADGWVKLQLNDLRAMEQLARAALADTYVSKPLRLLLRLLARLDMIDVKAALVLQSRGVQSLAARLGKRIAPVSVEGDDGALVSTRYADFFRSLVHVFRNAVDHGVEAPDERVLLGKPEAGSIRCEVRDRGDGIEIVIADDGRGVDRALLEEKVAYLAGGWRAVEAQALEALVFRQGLSSREMANEISGRGIGLAAVKAELEKVAGTVAVETSVGLGTRFRFLLPTGEPDSFLERGAERVSV